MPAAQYAFFLCTEFPPVQPEREDCPNLKTWYTNLVASAKSMVDGSAHPAHHSTALLVPEAAARFTELSAPLWRSCARALTRVTPPWPHFLGPT
jgi:hypothetical protein